MIKGKVVLNTKNPKGVSPLLFFCEDFSSVVSELMFSYLSVEMSHICLDEYFVQQKK
jgi:hypothetical protein